ncbi:MAG: aminotransferase class I/II-fold pyridoxal phosphate-dependent enzyme [Bdellovibrio sp.]|nr:aminotransferase class I/II-fold pyridoxal phosphate-dependent enzyme [Bdellovibrio sp.]
MHLNQRVRGLNESITMKLNSRAMSLAEEGRKIYNLTAGQLPFRTLPEFVELIKAELNFIRSFQYPPVAGLPELRKKILEYFGRSRNLNLPEIQEKINQSVEKVESDEEVVKEKSFELDVIVCNGVKHALSNVFNSLLDLGDEVIILTPHWVTYPEIVKFCRGEPIVIKSSIFDVFVPNLDDIKRSIGHKTKAIVINSPNNPTGTHYSDDWMKAFANLMMEHPNVAIISDEIYYEVFYFDPRPTYFYQYRPELLERTVILDGISKTLGVTGLRLGWAIGPKQFVDGMVKLQGQTTSGASALIQRALVHLDFSLMEHYLIPIKSHLRVNAQVIREKYRDNGLAHTWYQPFSAFYYMVDFSRTPLMKKYRKTEEDKTDYSTQICQDFLDQYGVAMVPGTDFGVSNSARVSLILEKEQFKEAMDILVRALADKL